MRKHEDDRPRAWGRDGYVAEGLQDAGKGIGRFLFWSVIIVAALIVAFFLSRWAYTEYYITTHCTMVLGTRVCQ